MSTFSSRAVLGLPSISRNKAAQRLSVNLSLVSISGTNIRPLLKRRAFDSAIDNREADNRQAKGVQR